jgi:hypothetical protein
MQQRQFHAQPGVGAIAGYERLLGGVGRAVLLVAGILDEVKFVLM